jgi:filamentous hemagglutinin
MANKAMGYPKTPKGYVWHHVEDAQTMQLMLKELHNVVKHTGGDAVIRHGI